MIDWRKIVFAVVFAIVANILIEWIGGYVIALLFFGMAFIPEILSEKKIQGIIWNVNLKISA